MPRGRGRIERENGNTGERAPRVPSQRESRKEKIGARAGERGTAVPTGGTGRQEEDEGGNTRKQLRDRDGIHRRMYSHQVLRRRFSISLSSLTLSLSLSLSLSLVIKITQPAELAYRVVVLIDLMVISFIHYIILLPYLSLKFHRLQFGIIYRLVFVILRFQVSF